MFEKSLRNFLKYYIGELTYAPTRWYFILSCFALAIGCYFLTVRSTRFSVFGISNFLFPKSIYLHRSTKNDLLYMLSFPIIAGLIFMPALALSTSGMTFAGTKNLLTWFFGEHQFSLPQSPAMKAIAIGLFTITIAMGADFGFYLHHWLFHKIPFLWEFHKVHHSAEVLTPLTDFRAHPVEILTYGMATGVGFGLVQGIFVYVTNTKIEIFTIMGLNAIAFVYYFMGYALRHSHFWISYGNILSHVFISPAQHQIHHSRDQKHWDKNFGGTFALWDWIFGTLYVPQEKEDLEFGINEEENKDFLSVWCFYVRPFQLNWTSIGRRIILGLMLVGFAYFAARNFARGLMEILSSG